MTRLLFSSPAWHLIPFVAAGISLVGYIGARIIVNITHQERAEHGHDALAPTSRYLHSNAHFRARAVSLIFWSGLLFGLAIILVPIPTPPTKGWAWLLWVNHYYVGASTLYLTGSALKALRVRLVARRSA